jgi:hypothetical protein
MDEQTRLFLWALAGGGGGGLLGAAFGALTGALTWRSGRAAGTALGLAVARAFARVSEGEWSPTARGALIGATDGFAFLGVLGAVGGFLAGRGGGEWAVAGPVLLSLLTLTGGAVFFGGSAYLLVFTGMRGVAWVFLGAVLGTGAVAGLHGSRQAGERYFFGTLAGAVVGLLLGVLDRMRRGRQQP